MTVSNAPIKKLGLMFYPLAPRAPEIAKKIIKLAEKRFQLELEAFSASVINREGVTLENLKADCLITIGGDGTILRALQRTNVPVLGINTGRIGFLTETDESHLEEVLDRLETGNYTLDRRLRLKNYHGNTRLVDSTNETVLHTATIAKMRFFEIKVDNELIQKVRADGLIIATPTGSTCYAMSVGSPILDPRVQAFVITPIAPFKLTTRPLVVPSNSQISISLIEPDKNCILVMDGQVEVNFRSSDILTCSLSDLTSNFIHLDYDFYRRFEDKIIHEQQ